MALAFKDKDLEDLYYDGKSKKIDKRWHKIILDTLDYTNAAPGPMSYGKYRDFHPLKGKREGVYAVTVTKNWRVTFRFDDGEWVDVNLEDYH